MASHSQPLTTASIVGVHYRVGKRIGEGSFGVIFEGELYSTSSLMVSILFRGHPGR